MIPRGLIPSLIHFQDLPHRGLQTIYIKEEFKKKLIGVLCTLFVSNVEDNQGGTGLQWQTED